MDPAAGGEVGVAESPELDLVSSVGEAELEVEEEKLEMGELLSDEMVID